MQLIRSLAAAPCWLQTLVIGAMLALSAVPFVGLAPEPPSFARGAATIAAVAAILATVGTSWRAGTVQRARIMRRAALILAMTVASLVVRSLVARYVPIPTMDLLPHLFGLAGEDVDGAVLFEGWLEVWLACASLLLAGAGLRRALRRTAAANPASPGPWDRPASPSTPGQRWNPATVLLFLIGLGTLCGAVLEGHWTAEFLSNSVHVAGTIVDPQPHPLIQFNTADGAVFQFRQNGSVSRPLGAEVPVAYETQDPAGTARADTFWANWSTFLGMLWIGMGFTVAPFFGFRARFQAGRW